MTTQRDAILIYGTNSVGTFSIRIFKKWPEFQTYIGARKLKLKEITFANIGTDVNARVRKSEGVSGNYYRIFWTPKAASSSLGNHLGILPSFFPTAQAQTRVMDPVIHAPDAESALTMLQYIRFSELDSSLFGFSVPLTSDEASSI